MLKNLGSFFFRYRDLLPVPLAVVLLRKARPTTFSWILGLPFILTGEGIRLWALTHIGPTTRTREICADQLVTSGPYAMVRNPLYFANLLKILGILLIAGDLPLGLIILVFYTAEFLGLIAYEEAFLEKRFPEEFQAYKHRVPAFLPRSFPIPDTGSAPFSVIEAVYSERKTFGSTGLILGALYLLGLHRTPGTAFPAGAKA